MQTIPLAVTQGSHRNVKGKQYYIVKNNLPTEWLSIVRYFVVISTLSLASITSGYFTYLLDNWY